MIGDWLYLRAASEIGQSGGGTEADRLQRGTSDNDGRKASAISMDSADPDNEKWVE